MRSFPLENMCDVLDRGRTDTATHGGFRNPYYALRPGEGEQPGIWLVGDHGGCLMSNGKLPDGARAPGRPCRRMRPDVQR
jgi:hypothetical protein